MLAETYPLLAHAAGNLLPYLEDPTVIEVRVTSAGRCFVVRFGLGKERVADVPPATLDVFLSVVAHMVGGEWRSTSPRLHAAFPQLGLRIQAGRPPISPGPWLVCRKHPAAVFPLDDFEHKGILQSVATRRQTRQLLAQPTIRATLVQALLAHYTIIISGAMGSAKTSLLNGLLHELRETEDRVVVLEEDPEARCDAADVEFVHTSEVPRVTMQHLGKDLLRMSAERVVVGEVRDGTALDMLKCFQVGIAGLATVHAPSAYETLARLEQLVQEVSSDPQRHLIGEAVDVILHMTQYGRSWRVTDLIAVDGWDGQQYRTRSLL